MCVPSPEIKLLNIMIFTFKHKLKQNNKQTTLAYCFYRLFELMFFGVLCLTTVSCACIWFCMGLEAAPRAHYCAWRRDTRPTMFRTVVEAADPLPHRTCVIRLGKQWARVPVVDPFDVHKHMGCVVTFLVVRPAPRARLCAWGRNARPRTHCMHPFLRGVRVLHVARTLADATCFHAWFDVRMYKCM